MHEYPCVVELSEGAVQAGDSAEAKHQSLSLYQQQQFVLFLKKHDPQEKWRGMLRRVRGGFPPCCTSFCWRHRPHGWWHCCTESVRAACVHQFTRSLASGRPHRASGQVADSHTLLVACCAHVLYQVRGRDKCIIRKGRPNPAPFPPPHAYHKWVVGRCFVEDRFVELQKRARLQNTRRRQLGDTVDGLRREQGGGGAASADSWPRGGNGHPRDEADCIHPGARAATPTAPGGTNDS